MEGGGAVELVAREGVEVERVSEVRTSLQLLEGTS